MKKILTILCVLFSFTGFSQVLISQIYAGGGSGSALYDYDYIELHNMGNASVDISAYTFAYGSKTSPLPTKGAYAFIGSISIPAGGYYLVKCNNNAGSSPQYSIPTPDITIFTSGFNLGADNGKVRMFADGTAGATVIDEVAWGTGTVNGTYGSPIGAFSKLKVGVRKLKGNLDTKSNNDDFTAETFATPRTSSSLPFKKSNSKDILISQIYPGGSNTNSTYNVSYIELKNNSNSDDLDIGGFALQYATSTGDYGGSGSVYVYTFPAGTIIGHGKYILVQTGKEAAGGGDPLPLAPDFTMDPTIISSIASPGGKIAFAGTSDKLACGSEGNPCGVNPELLDSVIWGAAPLLHLSGDTKGLVRQTEGCTNTWVNTADFDVVISPVPRNSSTPSLPCYAVPLELTGFSVQKTGSSVQINWSTAQEQNSKEFVVERSTDQSNWSRVASVAANGSSHSTANYSATDQNPAQGVNYYRLKMVDIDGRYVNSDVKSVTFSSSFSVSISPNPASSFINVTLNGNNNASRIIVSDLNGRVLYNQTTTAPKLQINSSSFAKGMYIIKVINGTEVDISKVIVQ